MNHADIGQLLQARREALTSEALVAGTLFPALVPTLLDEAPSPLIVPDVAEVAERTHTPPKKL